MANSILKEITFTPHAFEKNVALENERKFGDLINALIDIIDSGIIIRISNKWQKIIDEFIDKYSYNEKNELKSIFKQLKDKKILVTYPTSKDIGDCETDWINKVKEINYTRTFDAIVASKDLYIAKQINHFDKKTFKKNSAKIGKQTKDFVNNMLAPILSYTEIVKIMDPYFSLIPQKGNKKRYTDSLEIICKNLANHHGIKDIGLIEIQTSIKAMTEGYGRYAQFKWQLTDKWPNIIKKLEDKYGHTIIINIWEESNKHRWHDRWIITQQCGVYIGKGNDIDEWTDSTWGLLEWEDLPNIENKFDKNRGIFTFIGSVTSSNIYKKQNPYFIETYCEDEDRKNKEKYSNDLKALQKNIKYKK